MSMMFYTTLCILLVFVHLLLARYVLANEVLVHPESRLVPAGTEFSLSCKIRTTEHAYWVVNTTEATGNFHKQLLARKGLFIESSPAENGVVTLVLRVNGSYSNLNDTQVYCTSVQVHSEVATILIMNESPISPNPLLEAKSATRLVVKWSPPFLWPGHSIEYYNISVTNPSNGNTTYHRVNTTYSDALVSFPFISQVNQNCMEFLFVISAVKKQSDSEEDLEDISVVGGFPTAPGEFDVAVNVLFKVEGSPLVLIQFEIPQSICSYQEVTYTITVHTTEGESIDIVETHGSYQNHRHCTMIQETISGLERSKNYSLDVVIDTKAGNSSKYYSFNTSMTDRHHHDTESTVTPFVHGLDSGSRLGAALYVYKVLVSVSFSLVVLLLFALDCVLTCLLVYCKRSKANSQEITHCCQLSTTRVQHAMVHNPIYDGPMYEAIQHNLATPINNSSTTDSSSTNHHCPTSTSRSVEEPEKPLHRYVDQPLRLQTSPELPNKLDLVSSELCPMSIPQDCCYPSPSVNAPAVIMPNELGLSKYEEELDDNSEMLKLSLENSQSSTVEISSHNEEEEHETSTESRNKIMFAT